MIFSPTARDRKLMGVEGGRVILTRVWLCTFPWVSRKNAVHFLFRHCNLSKDIALETNSSICTYSKVYVLYKIGLLHSWPCCAFHALCPTNPSPLPVANSARVLNLNSSATINACSYIDNYKKPSKSFWSINFPLWNFPPPTEPLFSECSSIFVIG